MSTTAKKNPGAGTPGQQINSPTEENSPMTTIYREVEAAALDRWARRNGVTDTDLAEALEISPRAARRTRQGRRPLTATDVQLLAASQNLRPSELIAEFEAVTR